MKVYRVDWDGVDPRAEYAIAVHAQPVAARFPAYGSVAQGSWPTPRVVRLLAVGELGFRQGRDLTRGPAAQRSEQGTSRHSRLGLARLDAERGAGVAQLMERTTRQSGPFPTQCGSYRAIGEPEVLRRVATRFQELGRHQLAGQSSERGYRCRPRPTSPLRGVAANDQAIESDVLGRTAVPRSRTCRRSGGHALACRAKQSVTRARRLPGRSMV